MRIIKLSRFDKEMQSRDDVEKYFLTTLPGEDRRGRFYFPKGWLNPDFFGQGEFILFTYDGNCVYTARAASGRLNNTYDDAREYPYYFNINISSIRPTMGTLADLEIALQKVGIRQNLVKSHGWPILEDTEPCRSTVMNYLSRPIDYKDAVELAAQYASGESEHHKALKRYVAQHPHVVGLHPAVEFGTEEFSLPSGDSIDVLFLHAGLRLAVEVKSRISPDGDIVRGLFQCVKYRAILSACIAAEVSNDSADSVLVLEGNLPMWLNDLRTRLNVRVIENVDVQYDE